MQDGAMSEIELLDDDVIRVIHFEREEETGARSVLDITESSFSNLRFLSEVAVHSLFWVDDYLNLDQILIYDRRNDDTFTYEPHKMDVGKKRRTDRKIQYILEGLK
jgi:hypothetical protein